MKTIDFGPTHLGRIRQLTEELIEEEPVLHLFFRLSADLFCIADDTGYFRKINKAWQMILGWTEEELLAVPFIDFVHPDDVERTKKLMEHHMNGQDVIRFHNRYRRKPGTTNLIEGESAAGNCDYVVLEWSSTAWHNGLTCAAARQVPTSCLECSASEDRFGWIHRRGLLYDTTTKDTKSK
jgi:PAS domain S-box-containing protein